MRTKRATAAAGPRRIGDARSVSAGLNESTDQLNARLAAAERDIVGLNLTVSASIDLPIRGSNRHVLSLLKHNAQWGIFVSQKKVDAEYFLDAGIEGLELRASRGPTLRGEPLSRLVDRLARFEEALRSFDSEAEARVIRHMLHAAPLPLQALRERKKVEVAVSLIKARLEKKTPDLLPLTIDVGWEVEYGAARIQIAPARSQPPIVLDWNLANHPAYIELCAIEEDIRSIGPAPYFVKADGQKWETQLEDTDAVFDYIELRGRRNAPAQEAIPVSGLTPLLKCSRELRVAAATKMSELVDELVQQVNAQNEDVQQGVRALDQLLAELRGGAS